MDSTTDKQDIKAEVSRAAGVWRPGWDIILDTDPEFLRAYGRLAAVPRERGALDPLTREFVALAVDAAATHLHPAGVREHIRNALELGATREQIVEVLECTATLGIHAMNIGVPILVEVLEEKGLRAGPGELDAAQLAMKEEFTRTRGYWHAFWDEILELDPDLFQAYTDFSSVPWRTGTLSSKVREFIYIAFDTASTHLYVKGLKLHLENAVGYGATVEEMLEVMEIAVQMGMQAVDVAGPILQGELERRRQG